MRNCNMPTCNMPRYEMSRNIAPEMNRYMCDCENSNKCDEFPIGMGYVPWQDFKDLYEPERGLHAGTIFIELEKPFIGRRPFRR